MANVIKINSKLGMVKLSPEDMTELGLYKWLRTDSKGVFNRDFIDQQPFEKAASHLFCKEYPSHSVKIADKIILTSNGDVDVFLRIAANFSKGYYNDHPTKLTFSKSEGTRIDPNSEDYIKMYELGEREASKIKMKDLRDVVGQFFDEEDVTEASLDLGEDLSDLDIEMLKEGSLDKGVIDVNLDGMSEEDLQSLLEELNKN